MLLKFHRLPIHGQSSDLAGNLWDHESRLNEASPWATSPLILPPDQCWANSSLVPNLRFGVPSPIAHIRQARKPQRCATLKSSLTDASG